MTKTSANSILSTPVSFNRESKVLLSYYKTNISNLLSSTLNIFFSRKFGVILI